jgi:hypothetical protein
MYEDSFTLLLSLVVVVVVVVAVVVLDAKLLCSIPQ